MKNEMSSVTDIGTDLFRRGQWKEAREAWLMDLQADPSNHFLLTRIGACYYEDRKYKAALKWNDRAFKIMPTCPLVWWDRSGILDMLDRSEDAKRIWRKIVRLGIDGLRTNPCHEGVRWARSLVADSYVRLGMDASDRHSFVLAQRHYEMASPSGIAVTRASGQELKFVVSFRRLNVPCIRHTESAEAGGAAHPQRRATARRSEQAVPKATGDWAVPPALPPGLFLHDRGSPPQISAIYAAPLFILGFALIS